MKLAIAGLSGRMGQAISQLAEGKHELIGLAREDGFDAAHSCDAIIDFTRPEFSVSLAAFAAQQKIPLVSGTTGFSDVQWESLEVAALRVPVFWASNMSVGVALLTKLVREAAAALPSSYDIEVLEMHHKEKVDAPSGTALSLGKAAAQGRNVDFNAKAVLSREGQTGPREQGTIGFATLRGGRVIGDHSVLFAGENDLIEMTHRSQSRAIYAEGALRAAGWLQNKSAGLYGMADLLA